MKTKKVISIELNMIKKTKTGYLELTFICHFPASGWKPILPIWFHKTEELLQIFWEDMFW